MPEAAALHPRVSVNSLCFLGHELDAVARCWAAMGARTISFVGRDLERWDLAAVRAVVAEGGYRVDTIPHNFHFGALPDDAAGWAPARERLDRMIDRAAAIGARSIYLLTGARGAMGWEQAADAFASAVAPCAARADAAGVALLIENAPPHNADLHFAHTLRDTLTLAELSGLGVNVDIFGCWTEAGLDALLDRALPRCGVVQVSDYVLGDRTSPCRAVPGDGAIPLRAIIARLLAGGYAHGFDLELLGPRIDAEGQYAATRRAAHNLGALLADLGA